MIDTILPTPDLFGATRVLCIQPHYDDNDIAAAGTIARLVAQGSEVIYLTVTNDLMGVVDGFRNDDEARAALKRDQAAAGGHPRHQPTILARLPRCRRLRLFCGAP